MKHSKEINEKIERIVNYLKEKGCSRIFLFGSIAEGKYIRNSDIDIAVSGMNTKDFLRAVANLPLVDELLESHKLLVEKIKTSFPDQIERSAAAALLHSFYNGIENIFKRIANRIDGKIPTSEYWHQELLNQMGAKTDKRNEVISIELLEKLNLYPGFRHFFRHAYAFQFK